MSITETAWQLLENDQHMESMYSNPKKILAYLHDDANFRTLSSLIKDTMIEAGVCNSASDDSVFKLILTDLLFQTENECTGKANKDSIRRRVSRWIDGTVKSIERAESAIEICFALNLNLEETNRFLNRAGFSSLSVRRAEDAIYLYCLLQKEKGNPKSFSDVRKLIDRYYSEKSEENETDFSKAKEIVNDPNGTTIVLRNTLGDIDWESDDEFIKSYMLSYKSSFTNYSKHALFEFYKARNLLFVTSLLYRTRNCELDQIKNAKSMWLINPETGINKEDCPIQFALRCALAKIEGSSSSDQASVFLRNIKEQLQFADVENSYIYVNEGIFDEIEKETYSILLKVKEFVFNLASSPENFKSQKIISRFLLEISSTKDLYKTTLSVLVNNGEMHSFKSFLSVRGDLINEEAIAGHENNPYIRLGRNAVDTNRKTIILIYYLLFSFDYYRCCIESGNRADEEKMSAFSDLSFTGFIETVNDILKLNSFSPLYPPNQFDFFVLSSIRHIEIASTYNEFQESPFEFINEIFKLILTEVVRSWRGSPERSLDEESDEWLGEDLFPDDSWKVKLNQILDDWQKDIWPQTEVC